MTGVQVYEGDGTKRPYRNATPHVRTLWRFEVELTAWGEPIPERLLTEAALLRLLAAHSVRDPKGFVRDVVAMFPEQLVADVTKDQEIFKIKVRAHQVEAKVGL